MARKTSVTFFAALMTSAIPAVLAPEAWMSIALVSIAMLGYTGCLANMLSFPADVFPKSAVGSVYGLASMGSGFGGMLFTLITGWVVEHYSYTPVFFGFGILPLICATILWSCLANMLSFPADVFPKSAVGSVYGLASMGSGFGGMLFTLITGGWWSTTPTLLCSSGSEFSPLICATILWTLFGPLHPGPHSGVRKA